MSERRKTRKRRIEAVIGTGFLICILGIGLLNLIIPSKKISEEENRGLQQKPEFSVSSVTSGSYMDQYEKYQADQFVGRNAWRSLKVGFSRLAEVKKKMVFLLEKRDNCWKIFQFRTKDGAKRQFKSNPKSQRNIPGHSGKYDLSAGCSICIGRQNAIYGGSC